MHHIQTPIIPIRQVIAKKDGPHEIHKEALCVFMALGFFLDEDTYWKDMSVLAPASKHQLDADKKLIKSDAYFSWHYNPRNISFDTAVSEFTSLFESIVEEQVGDQKVILPLSGGLDSRSQAAALHYLKKDVHSYSYAFEGGYPETKLAKRIADSCGFPFEALQIENGYLWSKIPNLVAFNHGYSDFTHPRQMAVIDRFEDMGDLFSLGHWGDVLFDRQADGQLNKAQELQLLKKKILKKGGVEAAELLWNAWKLPGDFDEYLTARLSQLLAKIDIDNSSAKIRAFKSTYWAPRWTSVNLSVFESKRPIHVPYYDDRMCEFICTVPEKFLADRRIQIQYIKNRNSELAKIPWQRHRPFNLYDFPKNRIPYNLPYRLIQKAKREANALFGNPYIQRNWELQFLGAENTSHLEGYLYSPEFKEWIPEEVIDTLYTKFRTEDALKFSHPVSILLTMAVWKKYIA